MSLPPPAVFESGPLPERKDVVDRIESVLKEMGLHACSMRLLRRKLSLHFKVEFDDHKDTVSEIVEDSVAKPEFQKLLAMCEKMHREGKLLKTKQKHARKSAKHSTKKKTKKGGKMKKHSSEKKEKKQPKSKKPEGYPKGALTAYFIFMSEQRAEMMAGEEKLGIAEFGKKVGELWKAMSDVEKEAYAAKAVADKERFAREMAEYVANGGVALGKKGKKAKVKKESNLPKRPQSAYFIFSNEQRVPIMAEDPSLGIIGAAKKIAEKWKALSAEERVPYDEKADADRQRHERECAAMGITTKPKRAGGRKRSRSASESSVSSSDSDSGSSSSDSSGSSGSSSSDSDSDSSSSSSSSSSDSD